MKALQNSPRLYRPGWLESLLLVLKGAIVGTGAILPGIVGSHDAVCRADPRDIARYAPKLQR